MGAAISEVKNQIERIDDAKEKEQKIKEALENTRLMASDQLEALNQRIRVIGKRLGESSGSCQLQTRYIISIDPLGGISRLDALFFVYNFSSEGLMKTTKSVVAACVVKFSADVREVDDNTLRVLVNQYFETSPLDLRKAIYGELSGALFNSIRLCDEAGGAT
ncbi:hypothetical protein FRC11_000186 [Ceratobasidium sp. 423]|nr:hypothetical protein FRC11_000186 [Ceratobasidium sp. 423]